MRRFLRRALVAVAVGLSAVGAAALVAEAALPEHGLWPRPELAAFGLFSRVKGPTVADHPKRSALLKAISGSPGIRFLELRKATGLSNGALTHHLQKLEEAALVRAIRSRKYLAYVAGGASPAPSRHPALHSRGARRLAEVIRVRPGLHVKEAAALAGLDPSTASYHLGRMEAGRLVALEREKETTRLRIHWRGAAG